MPDNDRLSRSSNTSLKKTFQKLLQKRSGKAAHRPQKDPKQNSSTSSNFRQQHEPQVPAGLPVRAPPPEAAAANITETDSTRLDPDQASVHLDALGWEQATKGNAATTEYWQFAPRQNTLDLTSVASQHGTDDEAISAGLRTPPSAHERRRTGTQRLARDSHPSTINGSPGPSPASSLQLHRQLDMPQQQNDITPYARSSQQQHSRLLVQPQTEIMPYADSNQPQRPSQAQLHSEIRPYDDDSSQIQHSHAWPRAKKLQQAAANQRQGSQSQPPIGITPPSSSTQQAAAAAAGQQQAEMMPSASSEGEPLEPAEVEQQHRQTSAQAPAAMPAASQGQQSTPFASPAQQQPHQQLQQVQQQGQVFQQQEQAAAMPASAAREQVRQDSVPAPPAQQRSKLVSQPPSASWATADIDVSTPKTQQAPTYSGKAPVSKVTSHRQLSGPTADDEAEVGGAPPSRDSFRPGRLASRELLPAGPVSVEAAKPDSLSTMQGLGPFQRLVPAPTRSLSRELGTSSLVPPQPAWSPVPSPTKLDSDWQPSPSPRRHHTHQQPPPSSNKAASERLPSTSLQRSPFMSLERPPSMSAKRRTSATLERAPSMSVERAPSASLSRGPSESLSRVPSYPLARHPSTTSLGSTMGGPQYTSYSISPTQPSRRILPSYTGQDPMSNMPMQLQRHQDSDSAQAGSSQLPPLPADPAQARTPSLPTPPQQQAAQPRHKTSSRRSSSHAKSPRHDMRRSTSADRALPAGAPAAVQHSPAQQGSSEPVARAGPSTSLVSGSAVLDTMGQGSVVQGSDSHSGSRGSGPAGSTASSWLHSHSAHQLTANVRTLAAQVVTARSKQAQELAILKLYAVLSQAHFVKQQAADWEGAFLGILALGFPLVLKHTAEVVIHPDKGYSDMVRGMAAATLKSIARWMEGQLDGAGPCQALVQQVLTQLVQEANPGGARYSGAQGPTIHENEAWDAIMPTQQSFGGTETAGMGELLDSGTLDGMLDTDATSFVHPNRPDHRQPRWGVMETPGLVGTGSVLDSEAWQEVMQHRLPAPRSRPPSILETGATYMALDTQDVAEYTRSHARGLRLTFWLFKTDQEDAWYAASSLVGSMASLGEAHIDAMGGMKLVKPLFLVLRRGARDCKAAALRALQHLTTERACRAMTARQDSYLQALVRAVQQADPGLQYPATIILARLITNDPSTHYIVAQAGLIQALAKLVKQGGLGSQVREAVSEALKHLTASSQKNRDTLVAAQVLPLIIAHLQTGEEAVQYNTARTLRHLALGSQPAHKTAALPAVVPLTQALQVGRPRVQFACASALAMLVEGHAEMCPLVLRHGGVAALALMLQTAGAQGKKAAAEALQALAAEDVDMKPRIAKSGSIPPLISMVKTGNLQQQAAAAGALQALTYCPGRLDISTSIAAEGGIPPLVTMVTTGPLPLRSAAAGALCNLALASPHNQAAMMKAGAIPALVQLLQAVQPDGQYAAAAALYNLAGQEAQVRLAIAACRAVPPLVLMLQADSWYCRIVAAEVLGRLTLEWSIREQVEQAGAVLPLIHLLRLKHSPGMLDNVEGPVHHLAYERGEDVIVMKGYKFAKAKTAAAATLGCLALANSAVATQLVQAGVAEQLMAMLESSSAEVRAVAAACLGDLAAAHPPLQPYLTQRLSKLVRLLLCNFKQAGSVNRPDVAAAGAAIGLLVAQQTAARTGLLQLGGLKPLLAMLHQGTLAEQSVAANVLFDMSQGSEEAGRVIQAQGVAERVHSLVASTDTPAAAAGGGTAALLRNTCLVDYAGFAMTAKPSVNLLVLLQIPFEELTPARRQPHTLVPPDLLLTTVHSLGPAPSLAPLSLQNNNNLSPESLSGDSDQEEEEEPDSPLMPSQPMYPQPGHARTPTSVRGQAPVPPSWGGRSSAQKSVFPSSHSQSSVSDMGARQGMRQEQWAHPVAGQFQQQAAQQHILDTYVGS